CGEHRVDHVGGQALQGDARGAAPLLGPVLVDERPPAVEDPHAVASRSAREGLRQRLPGDREEETQEQKRGTTRDDERRSGEPHRTSKELAPVRPNTSGLYISSACVGGTTKRPGVVARARYR